MKKRLLAVLLIVTMFGTALALSGCGSEPAGEDEKEETGTEEETGGEEKAYTIGFSVSTLDNPFFVTMADAAKEEAAKLGISLETLDAEDSSETQQQQIEDFIMKEVDLIVINPVDSDAIGTSVIACNDAEIPVITVTRASNPACLSLVEVAPGIPSRTAIFPFPSRSLIACWASSIPAS